jgi:hypothetical protein
MTDSPINEPIFTKSELIKKLQAIKDKGWVKTGRPGNDGAVGNTLEDLLGIEENNLPIPNAAEWELKARRKSSSALTTLFHMEPSPTGSKIVPALMLPYYGWPHKSAGTTHSADERRFSLTFSGNRFTDRGFKVVVDRNEKKVKVTFDATKVADKHTEWLERIQKQVGLGELNPQPYYGFNDLMYKAGTKLKNCFYVQAQNKWEGDDEYFWFDEVEKLTDFNFEGFLECIEEGLVFIDFDARSGHNHGTKFRVKRNIWPRLYKHCEIVV